MSGIVYAPRPARFSYKCGSCGVKINGKLNEANEPCGEMEYWFRDRPKGQQNYHKKCWEDMQVSDPDQTMPDENSSFKTAKQELDSQEIHQPTLHEVMLGSKTFAQILEILDLKVDLVVALEDRVKKRVESNPIVEKYSSTETGYLKHDAQALLVNPALISDITQRMMAKINESAKSTETEGCADSFESMRGANSFHHPTAVKDESRLTSSENGKTQSTPGFANHLFFLINLGKRPILKCTLHGTICNESDYNCSKCIDEEDKRNCRRSLWSDF